MDVVDVVARDLWVPGPEIPQVPGVARSCGAIRNLPSRVGAASDLPTAACDHPATKKREIRPLLGSMMAVWGDTAVPVRLRICPTCIAQCGGSPGSLRV